MNLRGIPLRAVDTAGLRETEDEVEQIGVARTRESLASADLVLLVLDATVGETLEDRALQLELAERPHLIVWNKWDLMNQGTEPSSYPSLTGRGRSLVTGGWAVFGVEVPVSAATGWNITGLEEAIVECVLSGQAAPQEAQGAVVTHTRHRQALETARARLEDALATLEANLPADFLAIDVQAARTALGEITGQTVPEDVISEIFSRFCIGK
jgi:tRNA modification GTPase